MDGYSDEETLIIEFEGLADYHLELREKAGSDPLDNCLGRKRILLKSDFDRNHARLRCADIDGFETPLLDSEHKKVPKCLEMVPAQKHLSECNASMKEARLATEKVGYGEGGKRWQVAAATVHLQSVVLMGNRGYSAITSAATASFVVQSVALPPPRKRKPIAMPMAMWCP